MYEVSVLRRCCLRLGYGRGELLQNWLRDDMRSMQETRHGPHGDMTFRYELSIFLMAATMSGGITLRIDGPVMIVYHLRNPIGMHIMAYQANAPTEALLFNIFLRGVCYHLC